MEELILNSVFFFQEFHSIFYLGPRSLLQNTQEYFITRVSYSQVSFIICDFLENNMI